VTDPIGVVPCERCDCAPCACVGPVWDKGDAIYFSSKGAADEYMESLRELAELRAEVARLKAQIVDMEERADLCECGTPGVVFCSLGCAEEYFG